MKYNLLLLLLLLCANAQAQLKAKELTDTTQYGDVLTFPVFESEGRPEAAKLINQYFQQAELQFLLSDKNPNPFEKMKRSEELRGYSYKILENSAEIKSIQVITTTCPRLCTSTERYYTFNGRTGSPIEVESLFTAWGLKRLRQAVLEQYKVRITEHLKDPNFSADYAECLTAANAMIEFPISKMFFSDKNLSIKGGQCLDAASSAAPNAMSDVYSRPLIEHWWAFSPAGISLLYGSNTSGSAYLKKILHGKIDNKYPFTMLLSSEKRSPAPDTSQGRIVYDKYLQTILLQVITDGNKLIIHEITAPGQIDGTFECTWNGKMLSGTFTNLKTKAVMPFSASASD
jgi:hypothetical protein